MKIDGKAIAEEMYASLSERRKHIARSLTLGIVVSGANPVIESFVRIKSDVAKRLDIQMLREDIPAGADIEMAKHVVRSVAEKSDAVIVQLPIVDGLDVHALLSAIPKQKDVDAINPDIPNAERIARAPVALAVVEILRRGGVEIAGKNVVVVGAGRLVGKPSAALLKEMGANVSMFTLEEGSIDDLKDADIVVCGAGKPGLVKPAHIKEGVALIDAGASEQEGVILGDVDPACAAKAGIFTPVPGGVGPIAVAMIFKNLLDLAEAQ